jgi:hypothetical protein
MVCMSLTSSTLLVETCSVPVFTCLPLHLIRRFYLAVQCFLLELWDSVSEYPITDDAEVRKQVYKAI